MGSVGMGVAVHVCMCVCGPMYVCMMRSIICVGVGGIGVGGDGDVYLGESCTEEAENKGAQLRMMAFISLTLHGWTSGFFKRRCRLKSEGNHVKCVARAAAQLRLTVITRGDKV